MTSDAVETFNSPHVQRAIRALEFVDEPTPGQLDFWAVASTGNTDADIALGEQHAELALIVARMFNMPAIIGLVMRDIALSGRFGALEAGFVATIASAAKVGSYH